MFNVGVSLLAGHRSPSGVAEDCQRQSWVGGALFSFFGVNHQQKGHLPDRCPKREKGTTSIMRLWGHGFGLKQFGLLFITVEP